MKDLFKGKIATAIILLATFVLAGIAIFTAIRLYQLRQTSVSPNAPASLPKAGGNNTTNNCSLSFTLGSTPTPTPTGNVTPTPTPTGNVTPTPTPTGNVTPTPTPTGNVTPTPTSTPIATPTATPVPGCNTTCTQNSDCPSNLICVIASGATTGNCRNTSCTTQSSCVCSTSTPAPTQPALPSSGTDWPTTLGIGVGILTIIGSLILAL